MGIDIDLFRKNKGNDPEKIKEIQKKRFKPQEEIDRVDTVVQIDEDWRKCDYQVNQINKEMKKIQKEIGQKIKNKEPADDLIAEKNKLSEKQKEED